MRVLLMEGVTKEFPGVKALDNVDFELAEGEIHALVGANGAGKSTLLKILAGVIRADSGKIFFKGKQITQWSPRQVMEAGIQFIYQDLGLFNDLSVAQNILIGRFPKTIIGTVSRRDVRSSARQILKQIGVEDIDVTLSLGELSAAQQQLVAIARALVRNPAILVLDEPTARLGSDEVNTLFAILKKLRDENGVSIIFVSHRLEEVYQIADRVTVLRDGQRIITDELQNINPEQLVKYMVGARLKNSGRLRREKSLEPSEKVILEVSGLTSDWFTDINFAVHKREILGIVGAVGAGKTELAETIFGLRPYSKGQIRIKGCLVQPKSPRASMRFGVAFCPEDRRSKGLLLKSSIRENIVLASLDTLALGRWLCNPSREREVTQRLIKRLGIVPSIPDHITYKLSGGNQQKVVLAKWLCAHGEIFILDEPTVGVDVRGKQEIYQLIRELAMQGAGVLFITSDIHELFEVCTSFIVMHRGRIVARMRPDEASLDRVLYYVMGGPNAQA